MSRSDANVIVNAAVAYIQAAAERLQASKFSATALDAFRSKVSGELKRSSRSLAQLGWSDGNGPESVPADIAASYIDEQLHFLEGWLADIAQEGKLIGGVGRASMYGESLGQVYQKAYIAARGARAGLPDLPAYPRDGSTVCRTYCRCRWQIKKVSDVFYEARWILGKAEHCPQCIERSQLWNPISIIRQQGRDPSTGDLIVGDWTMSDARMVPIRL